MWLKYIQDVVVLQLDSVVIPCVLDSDLSGGIRRWECGAAINAGGGLERVSGCQGEKI